MFYKNDEFEQQSNEQQMSEGDALFNLIPKSNLGLITQNMNEYNNIKNILGKLKNDLSDENIYLVLTELISFSSNCNFGTNQNFMSFAESNFFNIFIPYVFSDRDAYTELVIHNINNIFLILEQLSKSKQFSDSIGSDFFYLFVTNYQKLNDVCHVFGINIVNQIFICKNYDEVSNFLDNQEKVDFLINIFPYENVSSPLIESLSSLYLTIIHKAINLPINVVQQFVDVFSRQLSYKQSRTFYDIYSQVLLSFLRKEPDIQNYLENYFLKFEECYNFSSTKGRNAIFQIYQILVENSPKKSYFFLKRLPTSVFDHFEIDPDLRISFLNFFLAIAKIDQETQTHRALRYIAQSKFFDVILPIANKLSYDCLLILCQLIEIFNFTSFMNFNIPYISEMRLKMISICVKVLDDDEQICFQERIINILGQIFFKSKESDKLKDAKDTLSKCHGVEIMFDLAQDYKEAEEFLIYYEYIKQDE